MDFFVQDCKGFFQDPKDTFKRISTYESLTLPGILLFLSGAIMGLKKFLVAGMHLIGKPKEMIMPYEFALRDSNYVMAVITPFVVLAFWYICSFIVNEVAERLGALKGEFPEILMASGHLCYPILAFEVITLPLFILGEVNHIKILSSLNFLLTIVFLIWLLYLMGQLVEVLCEVPMSIAMVSLIITILAFSAIYYGVIELVLNKMLLVGVLQKRYY